VRVLRREAVGALVHVRRADEQAARGSQARDDGGVGRSRRVVPARDRAGERHNARDVEEVLHCERDPGRLALPENGRERVQPRLDGVDALERLVPTDGTAGRAQGGETLDRRCRRSRVEDRRRLVLGPVAGAQQARHPDEQVGRVAHRTTSSSRPVR
jgi:hypothetical protein